jgi:hypothetical protein
MVENAGCVQGSSGFERLCLVQRHEWLSWGLRELKGSGQTTDLKGSVDCWGIDKVWLMFC